MNSDYLDALKHAHNPLSPRSRRSFLIAVAGTMAGTLASWPVLSANGSEGGERAAPAIADIEARVGGRVGVFALDTGSGKVLAHRPDERFAMCSTFKWVLAANVLAQHERHALSLDERISYGEADLLSYAPTTKKHVAEGSMTVAELARAVIVISDNTAANLLLARLGGPSAVTAFARSCGDEVTRLDRNEPELNNNTAGDLRDTTTPRAMAGLMNTVLCGDRLAPASREILLQWLRDCETGDKRLRAKLPKSWQVGDKTGTGERGAVNDVAIVTPPGRAPILIAAFLSEGTVERASLDAALADIGKRVADQFA